MSGPGIAFVLTPVMRLLCCVVAAVLAAPSAGLAQSTTADGVQALIRGEYEKAASILRPLAEESQEPEPLALFFMATLYHWGQGVVIDQNRACGFYLRAATVASPLGTQALALARSVYMDQPLLRRECEVAGAGRPPGASFGAGVDPIAAEEASPPTTADGVAAFLRGDYVRAAAILRPLAESWPSRDHVAEFFMAALHENGRAGPVDLLGACALSLRASGDYTSPFGRHAEALFQWLGSAIGKEAFGECALLANVGLEHGFEPVIFWLDVGHRLELSLRGGAITYNGQRQPIDHPIPLGGAVFIRSYCGLSSRWCGRSWYR
jgi:TPR repeat protein